jgi:hypothetical protein
MLVADDSLPLLSAFCLPPSAFRLLPSAFRLPPSAFCLPPSAFRHNPALAQTLAGQINQALALDATDEDAPRAAGITERQRDILLEFGVPKSRC